MCMQAGKALLELAKRCGDAHKLFFYTSPYRRSIETYRAMVHEIPDNRILGVQEEVQLREQDFGNFQDAVGKAQEKSERLRFGRFFYRFPNGESGADVYDRCALHLWCGLAHERTHAVANMNGPDSFIWCSLQLVRIVASNALSFAVLQGQCGAQMWLLSTCTRFSCSVNGAVVAIKEHFIELLQRCFRRPIKTRAHMISTMHVGSPSLRIT
jgi:hypothetical protein